MSNFYQNPAMMQGQQPMWNTGFQQQAKQPVKAPTTTLSEDDIKLLRASNNPQFSVRPTEIEVAKGKCNHHHKDGSPALNKQVDGTYLCDICGTNVDLDAIVSQEQVDKIVDDFCNLQEVIKFSNLYMPANVTASLYGNTIPFNRKMAAIFRQCAIDIGNTQANGNYYMRNSNLRGQQVFNALNGGFMAGSPMMNMQQGFQQGFQQQGMPISGYQPYPQQQFAGQGMGSPMMGGNPLYADSSQQQQMYQQPQQAQAGGFYQPQNANTQQVQQGTPATTEQTVRTSQV